MKKSTKLYKNKIFLSRRYVKENKTAKEIAEETGVSEKTIWLYLKQHNLLSWQR